MGKPKLENMDYSEASRRGKNIVLGIIDHLKVGEGLRIVNFQTTPQMRELIPYLEQHKPRGSYFKSRIDEEKGSYTIRRLI